MEYNGKWIRVKQKLTQEDLEKKSGISRATISALESGEQQDIKLSTLKALAAALDVSVQELCGL